MQSGKEAQQNMYFFTWIGKTVTLYYWIRKIPYLEMSEEVHFDALKMENVKLPEIWLA